MVGDLDYILKEDFFMIKLIACIAIGTCIGHFVHVCITMFVTQTTWYIKWSNGVTNKVHKVLFGDEEE